MALCLAQVSEFRIQIFGRWKSNSFMKYIRKQIEKFSLGLSNQMLANENFFHVRAPSHLSNHE